ncbi:YitT family protein [bacterium]|nr:YitT family protein [candidate division CSSED10-310 bacterium]
MLTKRLKTGFWVYSKISIGLILTALGLDLFLVPNKIAAGGVSGVSIVLFHLFHLPVGTTMLVINFFLFIVGFVVLGKGFGLRTLFATLFLSVFIDFFAVTLPWEYLFEDLLIPVIFGNLLTGIGMAIIFNQNASTGGTDIIARILNHFFKINIGKSLLIIDFTVAAGAGIFLQSMDIGMYSLLAVLVNCFTIDAFIDTLNISKRVLIISHHSDEIANRAMKELHRGATFIPVEGAYTGHPGKMLMMVIRPRQTASLREIVRELDSDAFMIVSNVNQVLGKGFQNIKDPSAEI